NTTVLTDDTAMQFFLDAEQLLGLIFLDGGNRDTRPAGDNVFDVGTIHDSRGLDAGLFCQGTKLIFQLALFLRIEAGLLEFMSHDSSLCAVFDEFDTLLNLSGVSGNSGLTQFDTRTGFVQAVNGL